MFRLVNYDNSAIYYIIFYYIYISVYIYIHTYIYTRIFIGLNMGSFYGEITPLIGIYGKLNYTLSSAYSARFTVNTIKTTLYSSLMPAPMII